MNQIKVVNIFFFIKNIVFMRFRFDRIKFYDNGKIVLNFHSRFPRGRRHIAEQSFT